jgi:starvation-inducible DNA-binding protein
MKKTTKYLNKLVAELSVFYQKLRHFHWHVTGNNFLAIHAKFEEIYDDVNEMIDELAERVVALDGKSLTSLSKVLELSNLIKENDSIEADEAMIAETISDLEKLSELVTKTANKVDETGDRHTANILDEALDKFESHVWMLKALKA